MLFKGTFITEAHTKVDFHHGTYCDVKTYKREYTFNNGAIVNAYIYLFIYEDGSRNVRKVIKPNMVKCANIKYGAIWEAVSNLKDMTKYQYETEM